MNVLECRWYGTMFSVTFASGRYRVMVTSCAGSVSGYPVLILALPQSRRAHVQSIAINMLNWLKLGLLGVRRIERVHGSSVA